MYPRLLAIAVVTDHDLSSGFRQCQANRLTNAPRSAGHHGYTARQQIRPENVWIADIHLGLYCKQL